MDRLLGAWLVLDGLISLAMYIGKPDQTWAKDHSFRLVRVAIGAWYLVKGWRQ